MKRKCWLLSLLLLAFVTPAVQAAVFERDWKVAGDSLLTFDDVNNREWLDVPLTIPSPTLPNYESVVAATMPGGMFEGFVAATSDDVIALAQSASIDTSTLDFGTNQVAAAALIDLLGMTAQFGGGSVSAAGLLDEVGPGASSSCPCRLVADVRVIPPIEQAGLSIFSAAELTGDRPFRFVGVMLYHQVPEPSSFSLVAIVISIFATARAIRRNC